MLIFIVATCKKLEKLEINSDQISDGSVREVLKKLENLKYLDLVECSNVNGMCFFEDEEFGCKKLEKLII